MTIDSRKGFKNDVRTGSMKVGGPVDPTKPPPPPPPPPTEKRRTSR